MIENPNTTPVSPKLSLITQIRRTTKTKFERRKSKNRKRAPRRTRTTFKVTNLDEGEDRKKSYDFSNFSDYDEKIKAKAKKMESIWEKTRYSSFKIKKKKKLQKEGRFSASLYMKKGKNSNTEGDTTPSSNFFERDATPKQIRRESNFQKNEISQNSGKSKNVFNTNPINLRKFIRSGKKVNPKPEKKNKKPNFFLKKLARNPLQSPENKKKWKDHCPGYTENENEKIEQMKFFRIKEEFIKKFITIQEIEEYKAKIFKIKSTLRSDQFRSISTPISRHQHERFSSTNIKKDYMRQRKFLDRQKILSRKNNEIKIDEYVRVRDRKNRDMRIKLMSKTLSEFKPRRKKLRPIIKRNINAFDKKREINNVEKYNREIADYFSFLGKSRPDAYFAKKEKEKDDEGGSEEVLGIKNMISSKIGTNWYSDHFDKVNLFFRNFNEIFI